MQLEIRERVIHHPGGDVTVLDLIGKITIGEGSVQLRDAVSKLLDAGHNQIILNLGGVTYMDSSGIGELVSRFTTTKNSGGKLKLLHLPAKLNELLHVTQLITVFEVYENEQEALGSF